MAPTSTSGRTTFFSRLYQGIKSRLPNTYLALVGISGLSLVVLSLLQIITYKDSLNMILLFMLAAVSELAATFVNVGKNKMAYEVGTAVSLAAIPLFGPPAAVVSTTIAGLSFWLVAKRGTPLREKNWRQPFFNTGMHSIAIMLAGIVFVWLESRLVQANPVVAAIVLWVSAAVVYDQVNFWLLALMLRLMQGKQFKALAFWRENRWAMVINVIVLVTGGFLLSFAVSQFDWIGIIIFFLPIGLSSLAFLLYVRQMRAHMDNLEAIITERTQELSLLMQEKDAFLALLTHDMKTPLASLNLYINLVKTRPEILQERPHMTDMIIRSQRVLIEMVDNILDLEKLKQGEEMPMTLEPMDLIPLVEYELQMLAPLADEKEISLTNQTDLFSIIVKADSYQMGRIIRNLLSNAIKYTPNGGKVEVEVCTRDGYGQLDVRDNGYGIPAEELPFIFDRFHQVPGHKHYAAGTGLGLAITKALIEAHHGEIHVTSKEGEGSNFTVRLPRLK